MKLTHESSCLAFLSLLTFIIWYSSIGILCPSNYIYFPKFGDVWCSVWSCAFLCFTIWKEFFTDHMTSSPSSIHKTPQIQEVGFSRTTTTTFLTTSAKPSSALPLSLKDLASAIPRWPAALYQTPGLSARLWAFLGQSQCFVLPGVLHTALDHASFSCVT